MRLEIEAIAKANPSIGKKAIGLKEKWNDIDKALPISRLATNENKNNSTLATAKETRH